MANGPDGTPARHPSHIPLRASELRLPFLVKPRFIIYPLTNRIGPKDTPSFFTSRRKAVQNENFRAPLQRATWLNLSQCLVRHIRWRGANSAEGENECGIPFGSAPNWLDRPRQNGAPHLGATCQRVEVTALTRNPEGRERAARSNFQSESKIAGVVASADMVVSAISDDVAPFDIVFRAGGLKGTLNASQIFVEIGTVSRMPRDESRKRCPRLGWDTFGRSCRAQQRWRRKEP